MNTQRIKLVFAAVVLLTVVLALAGPRLFGTSAPHPATPAPGREPVRYAKGVVESEHEVLLGSPVAGVLTAVRVTEGDAVAKGELLASLDAARIQAQRARAEAQLTEKRERLREKEAGARREDVAISGSVARSKGVSFEQARLEYERQQRLYQREATTRVELESARERMKVAQAQLDEARENERKQVRGNRKEEIAQARAEVAAAQAELAYFRAQEAQHEIRAPRSGLIIEKLKEGGESVDVGTPVLKLIDPATPRVRAELEESDIGSVRAGQQVEVASDSYPGRLFAGTVYQVLPAVKKKSLKNYDPLASFDMNSQTIYLRLADYGGLKNGMTVTVRFRK